MTTPPLAPLESWRLPSERKNPEQIRTIVFDEVARAFGMMAADLTTYERTRRTAWARQVAMALFHEFAGISYFKIGKLLDRDRTTIQYAVNTVAGLTSVYPHLSREVGLIRIAIIRKLEVI